MNDVQNKQQRQRRNAGTAGSDTRIKARHAGRAKQVEGCTPGIEKTCQKAERTVTDEMFVKAWRKVVKHVMEKAPDSVRTATTESVQYDVKVPDFTLFIPVILRDYIENNMDEFKPILWPVIRRCGCYKLIYKN